MTTEYDKFKLPQRWNGDAYTKQLLGLLPKGMAWVFDKFLLYSIIQDVISGDTWQDTYTSAEEVQDAIRTHATGHLLTRLLSCFAAEMANVESEAWRLINQTDPGVATDTLEDWERVLGLPEDCFADEVLTVEERQRQAHTKLFARYEVTDLDFYLSYAAELGFSISLVQIPIEHSPRIMGVARMSVERMGGRGGFSILQVTIGLDEIVDGDMEVTGPDVIVDGDMEVTGPDVIVDGDMEVTGPDVCVNGDFSAWADPTVPDNWTKAGTHDVNNYVEESVGGGCRVVSDGTLVYIWQAVLTIGKTYRIKVDCSDVSAGSAQILLGTTVFMVSAPGSYDFVGVAAGNTQLSFKRTGGGFACDVTIDNLEVIDETVACAAWTVGSSALLSKQEDPHGGAQCVRVEYGRAANPLAFQTILTIGKTYRVKGWARGGTGLTPIVRHSVTVWTGVDTPVWQAFDVVFVAGSTTLHFRAWGGMAGQYVEYDDVVVTDETVACVAWTVGWNALLSKQENSHGGVQCIRIEYGGSASPAVRQIILTVGKTYRVHGWAKGDGTRAPVVKDNVATLWTGTTSTSWQYFDEVFVAAGTSLYLITYGASAGQFVEFDDVVVTDETVSCAAWSIGDDALLSKQGDAYEASQCLRVEYDGTDSPYTYQTILTVGKLCRLTGVARGDGTQKPSILDSTVAVWEGTVSTSWQPFDIVFIPTTTDLRFRIPDAGSGYIEFDDVEIIEKNSPPSDNDLLKCAFSKAKQAHVVIIYVE